MSTEKVSQYSYDCFTSRALGRHRQLKIARWLQHRDNAARNVDGRPPLSLIERDRLVAEGIARKEKKARAEQIASDILFSILF